MQRMNVNLSPGSIIPLIVGVFGGLLLFQVAVHVVGGFSALVKDLLLALLISIILYYLL